MGKSQKEKVFFTLGHLVFTLGYIKVHSLLVLGTLVLSPPNTMLVI
jgi:hypothetical protein